MYIMQYNRDNQCFNLDYSLIYFSSEIKVILKIWIEQKCAPSRSVNYIKIWERYLSYCWNGRKKCMNFNAFWEIFVRFSTLTKYLWKLLICYKILQIYKSCPRSFCNSCKKNQSCTYNIHEAARKKVWQSITDHSEIGKQTDFILHPLMV